MKPFSIDYSALARELAPLVAPLVFARLAGILGAAEEPFSTRRGHEPPEFRGRPKAWRRAASTIPGNIRLGRWVSVPRAAYAAWLESKATATIPKTAPANDASEPWDPSRALAEAGLRPTR